MLAALAVLNRPASFADLAVVLQFGEARLRDAVAATRAMFLQVNTASEETTYSLDEITRSFIAHEAETLDFVATIKARVKSFEKDYFPEIPQISRLSLRARDFVRKADRNQHSGYLQEAWSVVSDSRLPAGVTEHPQFKSLYGYVASRMRPPQLEDARAAFSFIFGTKYEPPAEHLRA